MVKTYKITISGQVQGVGFRPYVFVLAQEFNLKGTVSNNEEGVIIYLHGEEKNVTQFYDKLINFPPPVSKIQTHQKSEIKDRVYTDFKIIPSTKSGQLNLPLTPDFAICEDCKNDIENTENKRYNYPFTTCVNCGPRWAITETFPFERAHTSIDEFPMCEDCLEEYTNPSDRRFHSQTNTCKTCGINLYLEDVSGNKLEVSKDDIFNEVARLLSEGNLIALKNTSGYLLCCNAEDKQVVKRLRQLKNRPNKPFAVLFPSMEKLEDDVFVSEVSKESLTSTERPITILSLNNYNGNITLDEVAPGLNQLGVMLPFTAILQLLANELDFPIVATSGNIHGSPIIANEKEALNKLRGIADYFLQHNLNITHPQDDSVLKFSFKNNVSCLFRRSRGYAPNYLNANISTSEKIMAMGADLKSSIAFLPNEHLYVSQYLGSLENFDVYERFINETKSFVKIFEQQPEVVLVDKHPKYYSSQFGKEIASEYKAEVYEIQHHKAHFAAVLGEHDLIEEDNVLGVVWDGTGFGDDGQIWGGEFFKYENKEINRVSHFDYFNWIAGDKMSKEPRLSLFSIVEDENLIKEKFSLEELSIYKTIKKNNKLKTSSLGRLFDAVASVLNICDYNSYEGEAAILLENRITDYDLSSCKSYHSNFEDETISGAKIINEVAKDFQNGKPVETIIANFLFTLASIILDVAEKQKCTTICCSGGVFQNTTLLDMLVDLKKDKQVLNFNRNFAPNDENIAFGQLIYYLNCLKK